MIQRSYNRQYGASPKFTWKSPTISTSDPVIVSWEDENEATQKYLPFNLTRIVNNSGSGITVYFNQKDEFSYYVPAGTIITIDRSVQPAVRSYKIVSDVTNTIQENEVIITASNEAQTTDSIVSRLHRRLLGG